MIQPVVPPSPSRVPLGLDPPLAWTAILALILVTAIGVVGAPSVIRLAFPVCAFAVGVLLYKRYPVLYIGFTWWIWFLTPLVARIADYRGGWDTQRLMLVTPFLVTLISTYTLYKHLTVTYRQGGLPFLLAFAGIIYGLLIGVVNRSPVAVARALLDWFSPVVFSFHLYIHWRSYPEFRQNFQKVFTWAVLLTGIYGIYQYLVAPEWDRYWLLESKMDSSAGKPEPQGMRVWSTMHSPGPYAMFLIAGLLLLFNQARSPLQMPAAGVGYLSFLLSLVRSAWGGWVAGLMILTSSLKPKLQMRLFVSILLISICAVPLATMEPFSSAISKRFDSLSNVQGDQSFNDRSANYAANLEMALSSGLGSGLGGTWAVGSDGAIGGKPVDSGVLETFFTLGWFGGLPYMGGLGLMLFRVMRSTVGRSDGFMSAARATCVACFTQLLFTTSTIGLAGMILWGFLGISMAADQYYTQAQKLQMQSALAPIPIDPASLPPRPDVTPPARRVN